MTFIACFKYKNTDSIFLLADGLLSTEDADQGTFIMPGKGKVGRPKSDLGYYMDSLEQKLNVLGPDLAFAYAGDRDLGARFGEDLHDLYSSPGFSFSALKDFCDKWPDGLAPEEKSEVSLLCICREDDTYQTWSYEMKQADGYKHFSKLLVSGSGVNNFQDTIDQESDVIDSDDKAMGHAMNILNKFYHDDLFVGKNYAQSFGGFYELAACTQEGITKVTDIFISTIHVDVRQLDRGIALPLTFLKYDTLGDATVLRELKAHQSPDSDNPDFENSGHIYFPLVSARQKAAWTEVQNLQAEGSFFDSQLIGDLKSKHTVVMLEIVDEEFQIKIPLYWRKSGRDSPIQMTLKDGKVEAFLSNELLEAIYRNIETNIDTENKCLKREITEKIYD